MSLVRVKIPFKMPDNSVCADIFLCYTMGLQIHITLNYRRAKALKAKTSLPFEQEGTLKIQRTATCTFSFYALSLHRRDRGKKGKGKKDEPSFKSKKWILNKKVVAIQLY